MSKTYDLAIVGAGPAGQAAAEQAAAAGLRVAIVDEQARMGGQILRQPPTAFRVANWLPGASYRRLKRQLARAEALNGVDVLLRTSVVGVFAAPEGFALALVATDGGSQRRITATRLLVAAGCYDMPVALPGWTLPGVMSAGGVQAFIKSQQIVPGETFVLAGTHPLQLLLGAQILAGGGRIAAVLFAQPLARILRLLAAEPLLALRFAPLLRDAAAALWRLRRAGVPIRFGRTVIAANGGQAVAAVTTDTGAQIACDRLALCFGFLPQADIPRALGAAMRWADGAGGWRSVHDSGGRTDVPGLYVAGEVTGIGGAQIALEEGMLAGLAIAADAGRLTPDEARHRAAPAERRLSRLTRFARLLDRIADPSAATAALPRPDTILCRCEGVRFADIDALLASDTPPASANALKLVTRAGMGPCQGRNCERTLLCHLRDRHGRDPGAGGFTPRFPIRPVPIGSLIDE